MAEKIRCDWCSGELMIKYHDEEWGIPVHEDKKLFEFLILEGAQAGLSWEIVLKKRDNYRKAFHNFDPKKISKYTKKDFNRLMNNEGIIRNQLKINATIINAKKFLEVKKEFGSFNKYIWSFVNHKTLKNSKGIFSVPKNSKSFSSTIKNKFKKLSDIPAITKESEEMSNDLLKRGFKFVGPTICYAFMQAVGMVNDHYVNCFRYNKTTKFIKN